MSHSHFLDQSRPSFPGFLPIITHAMPLATLGGCLSRRNRFHHLTMLQPKGQQVASSTVTWRLTCARTAVPAPRDLAATEGTSVPRQTDRRLCGIALQVLDKQWKSPLLIQNTRSWSAVPSSSGALGPIPDCRCVLLSYLESVCVCVCVCVCVV